jgi:hypothetical protein
VVFVSSQRKLPLYPFWRHLRKYNTMSLFLETAYVQDRLPMLMTQLNLQN